MTKEEISKKVNDALAKEFELNPSLLTPQAQFVSLGLDSLDAVDMVITLEQSFKVDIRGNYKMGDLHTLSDLYAFIEKLLKQKENA